MTPKKNKPFLNGIMQNPISKSNIPGYVIFQIAGLRNPKIEKPSPYLTQLPALSARLENSIVHQGINHQLMQLICVVINFKVLHKPVISAALH